jgi:hypothetical protein
MLFSDDSSGISPDPSSCAMAGPAIAEPATTVRKAANILNLIEKTSIHSTM